MADKEKDPPPPRGYTTQDIPSITAEHRKRGKTPRRWKLWMILAAIVVAPLLIFALWSWITLSFAYSSGERAGYVQKFSEKGWLCKTWEGELAMVNLPGAMPEIFRFSVRDDAVARQLNQSMGERVTLHYEQHRGVPTNCFGETQYFVNQVRRVGPAVQP